MEIRIAGSDDVRQLARMLWWNSGAEQRTGRTVAGFAVDLASWWAEHRSTHSAFVATTSDGTAVGMAWLALVGRPPRPGLLHRLAGDVQSVFVLPEHRGRGVGSALVRAALDHAESRQAERVTVHSGTRAMPVYQRLGFAASARLMMRPDE